jgi:hypothetical protein
MRIKDFIAFDSLPAHTIPVEAPTRWRMVQIQSRGDDGRSYTCAGKSSQRIPGQKLCNISRVGPVTRSSTMPYYGRSAFSVLPRYLSRGSLHHPTSLAVHCAVCFSEKKKKKKKTIQNQIRSNGLLGGKDWLGGRIHGRICMAGKDL